MEDVAKRRALLGEIGTAPTTDLPVAVVVAHPDDETLSFGARLAHLRRLTLIHLTDGAPADMGDARQAGFQSRAAYAEARRLELEDALGALAAAPERRLAYGFTDQELIGRLPDLVARLTRDLEGQTAVISHPYEGGHPDHDAAAFAVQAACRRLGQDAPLRLEFAGYHLGPDGLVSGVFPDDAGKAGIECAFSPDGLARKAAALGRFVSQARVLERFPCGPERLRLAPDYDFRVPPAPGPALYDTYGWPLTSELWRRQAGALL